MRFQKLHSVWQIIPKLLFHQDPPSHPPAPAPPHRLPSYSLVDGMVEFRDALVGPVLAELGEDVS